MSRTLVALLFSTVLAGTSYGQCPDNDPQRNPYFGDLHVHSSYSFDAIMFGVENGPREAYDFARGAPVPLPPFDLGETAQLRRPLDFTAVTDHAEFFGEGQICSVPGLPGYNSQLCTDYRGVVEANQDSSTINPPGAIGVFLNFAVPLLIPNPTRDEDICGPGAVDCPPASATVWADIQAAAEEKNAPCDFSTFHGWEWTANTSPTAPGLAGLHRNVIFRSSTVPSTAVSYIEANSVEELWDSLVTTCIDGNPDCDALTIPHNSNFSAGQMFAPFNSDDGTPLSKEDAAFRASIEPVVEIHQHKGSSECRPGSGSSDELCAFESLDRESPLGVPSPGVVVPPLSFVREGLKEGLAQEHALGLNPFPLGIIGSTDGHNGASGATHEADFGFDGHQGSNDWSAERILNIQNGSGIESNGGGLAVVWAKENTRAELFDAIRRREVYGTSGTRPIVRTFAGNLPKNLCDDPDFVGEGYKNGVPMGGELGAVRGSSSPRIAVLATQDPGPLGEPGTLLQRVQIVKGWVDGNGGSHERVYDAAGDPDNGADVDLNTCTPQGTGFASLCTVWRDPDFDADQSAFYYARVIENPTCRWSTHLCNSLAVDCNNPGQFANCCNTNFPKTIQERAWTSPVFYRPGALGKTRGKVKFGKQAGEDILDLNLRARSFPTSIDPGAEDLTIELLDDNGVAYAATLPAGTLQAKGSRFTYNSPAGQIAGIRFVTLRVSDKGRFRLRVKTRPIDLSTFEQEDGEIELRVSLGDETLTHRRIWEFKGGKLQTR